MKYTNRDSFYFFRRREVKEHRWGQSKWCNILGLPEKPNYILSIGKEFYKREEWAGKIESRQPT